jgi:hypothetical protein
VVCVPSVIDMACMYKELKHMNKRLLDDYEASVSELGDAMRGYQELYSSYAEFVDDYERLRAAYVCAYEMLEENGLLSEDNE